MAGSEQADSEPCRTASSFVTTHWSNGSEYVAYFPSGGTNHIELAAGSYRMEWLHPETGGYFEMPRLDVPAGSREFVPPERPIDDWVLHLRQRDGP